MNAWRYFVLVMALVASEATAQVPEMGRWQELEFSAAEVHDLSANQYRTRLLDLKAQNLLDGDMALQMRVHRIAATLIQAAIVIKPELGEWNWEIHTSSEPDIDALCMAGGKLLIGSRFVYRLELTDGELAILIGHEVAHAMADHYRETLSHVRLLNPLSARSLEVATQQYDSDMSLQIRLFTLSSIQESEADQLGMLLAHRAGWPTTAMVSFYQKLETSSVPSMMSGGYPAAVSRVSMAKGLTMLFAE